MMLKFPHALIALACVVGAGAAQAQTTVITRDPAPVVRLTPAQRTVIYRTIVREPAATLAQAPVEYRIGARVPEGMQLYAVPDTVAVEVPAIRTYRYLVVNNRVVLVDPATSEVVAEIEQ